MVGGAAGGGLRHENKDNTTQNLDLNNANYPERGIPQHQNRLLELIRLDIYITMKIVRTANMFMCMNVYMYVSVCHVKGTRGRSG